MTNTPSNPIRAYRNPRFFISYCVDDKKFVFETCNILSHYLGQANMFLFEDHPSVKESFIAHIKSKIKSVDFVIVFVGERFGVYQEQEIGDALAESKALLIVGVGQQNRTSDFPEFINKHAGDRHKIKDKYTRTVPPGTVDCAKDILHALEEWWKGCAEFPEWCGWDEKTLLNGLPAVPQLFDYEKNIVEFYRSKRLQEHIGNECDELRAKQLQGTLDEFFRERLDTLRKQWPDAGTDKKIRYLLESGVPAEWPHVYRFDAPHENPLETALAGAYRQGAGEAEAFVRAVALPGLDPLGTALTFPEAGPRPKLSFPRQSVRHLNVGILVAGGIAPGINAVIDALVQRHNDYLRAAQNAGRGYALNIYGVKNGFVAFGGQAAVTPHLAVLSPRQTIERATRGGSMLGTSRDEGLLAFATRNARLQDISRALSQEGRAIDILYVIGGDGSMKAAHALWHVTNRSRPEDRKMAVVTIPKTMDNDILWVWQSFGFLSAVDESRRIVETLYTEVRSNPRLGIVQLFGSDSGFVVSHAVLASSAGHTLLALIPEIQFSAIGVARYLKKRLWESAAPGAHSPPMNPQFPHGLVVMAETAVPLDALECLGMRGLPEDFASRYPGLAKAYGRVANEFKLTDAEQIEIETFCARRSEGKRLEGQTSDVIRKLGLSIMAKAVPVFLGEPELLSDSQTLGWDEPAWDKLRIVCSEPRHLVRSLEPSTSDIIHGQRLGLLAVDAAMAGYTDCMISQWLTEFALIPLELVVLGRKRIPPQGMFWKSVVSKTGQERDLVAPWT